MLNAKISELNGVSHFHLMFNSEPNLSPDSGLIRILPDAGATDEDRIKWISHQQKMLSVIFPAVNARQVAIERN